MSRQLSLLWDFLNSTTRFVRVTNYRKGGSNGYYKGQVVLDRKTSDTVIFQEKGIEQNTGMHVSNTYRWVYRDGLDVSLEHLRQGEEYPVFLTKYQVIDKLLKAMSNHLCAQDIYQSRLTLQDAYLELVWKVRGPAKNGFVLTRYFSSKMME